MILYLISALTLLLDQWLKFIIKSNMALYQSIPVLKNIFHLTYVQNTGAGFGILAGHRYLFVIISLLVIGGLLIFRYRQEKLIYLLNIATGLIIGGAFGNIIDRLRLGFVVDYLDFQIWPIFNLADTAVVIGVSLLIIYLWKVEDIS